MKTNATHYIYTKRTLMRLCMGIFLCMIALIYNPLQALNASHYASRSQLAEGLWVKVSVGESGIHQITYQELKKWGFSNPAAVTVYGYGGAILPETFSDDDIDDLNQLPVLDTGSKILFYAQGPVSWSYDEKSQEYKHTQNPYSTAGYYFLTDSKSRTATLTDRTTASVAGATDITSFDEHAVYEQDQYSPGATGRTFLGEDFRYTTSRNFTFELPGVDNSEPVKLRTVFAAKVVGGTSKLVFTYQGETMPESSTDNISAGSESSYEFFKNTSTLKEFNLDSEELAFSLLFRQNGGSLSLARLDYFRFNYKRKLQLYNGSIQFRLKQMPQNGCYALPGYTTTTHIWDISNPQNPVNIIPSVENGVARFGITAAHEEYVAFDTQASVGSVTFVETVANQDLHGMATPDMVILTPKEYLSYAQSIAQLHQETDGLEVAVIEHTKVFNEFSSGTPDATAYRRLMKMFFDREGGIGGKQLYLLLFGKGLYDNRKIGETGKYVKYPTLLTYQHGSGNDERASYTTDDYFGFLDDGSGVRIASDKLRVSVGRLPVKSEQEAKDVVDKLLNYVANTDKGSWKNQVCVVADDENYATHMKQAEDICNILENSDAHCFVNKIYTDAYTAEITSTGRTYPSAKKKLFQVLADGVLVVDYIGHGSTVAWTHENLLNITDIQSMYLRRLPLFITATCDFGRYDHEDTSGGEILCLNPSGGGIALITTTRVVYISDNHYLNKGVAQEIFKKDENSGYPRLGDILREAKCNIQQTDSNKLNYTLLGDPALKLLYPDYQIKVTEINGQDITQTTPTIQARDSVVIKGEIYTPQGEKATDYNGIICPTVYDSEVSVVTHGYGEEGEVFEFSERSNRLYVGKDSIVGGQFEIAFKMPREINFADDRGLINLYCYNDQDQEGSGNESNFIIGGFNDNSNDDFDGPEIYYAFLNSQDFQNGDEVNESPMLIAEVYDPSGINISDAGIGHQMTVTIDNQTLYTDVASYFDPAIGDPGRGFINYPLSDLSEGNHTLKLKVWDTENNSSEVELAFTVKAGLKPVIYDLYADQNPASTSTNFYLRHNRPDAIINVTISVYNLMGIEVWRYTGRGLSDMYRSYPISWDLTDSSGRRVPGGIYLYKALISTDNEHEATRSKKLCVTGQ
ncbi:hypothetical protein B5G10_06885 [Barnesiella sp. An55]|nr:hypothetical protein B5G10_06885 [Barnesiella sp. An55]